jgi:hypothetical protein
MLCRLRGFRGVFLVCKTVFLMGSVCCGKEKGSGVMMKLEFGDELILWDFSVGGDWGMLA